MKPSTVLRLTLYRTLAVALTALAVLSAAMPAPAFAADSDQQVKTVRVGWLVNNKGFQEGTPASASRDGATSTSRPSRITQRAGNTNTLAAPSPSLWTCSRRAKSTSCPTSRIRQSASQKLLFSSNPEGTERYYIYARPDRDDLAKGDPQALQGLTIGCNAGVMQTIVGQQWLADEGVTCTYKEIDTGSALFEALADGEVDAVIMNDTISSPDASPMFYVGSSDYYFAVPKSRPDLMNDINAAMATIARDNPRYNEEVKSSYSTQNSGSSSLTGTETTWLKENGNTITLGYLKNQLPYCTQNDDGEMEGSLASLATTLHDKFGITVNTIALSNNKQMIKALSNGTHRCRPAVVSRLLARRAGRGHPVKLDGNGFADRHSQWQKPEQRP